MLSDAYAFMHALYANISVQLWYTTIHCRKQLNFLVHWCDGVISDKTQRNENINFNVAVTQSQIQI